MLILAAAVVFSLGLLVGARAFALGLDRMAARVLLFPALYRRLNLIAALHRGLEARQRGIEEALKRERRQLLRVRAVESRLRRDIAAIEENPAVAVRVIVSGPVSAPVFLASVVNTSGQAQATGVAAPETWVRPQAVLVRAHTVDRARQLVAETYSPTMGFRVVAVEPASPDLVRQVWGVPS